VCLAGSRSVDSCSGDWQRQNATHAWAQAHQLTHLINGQVMAILIDDDPVARKMSGVLALQIEQYGAGRISFRNIWLRQLASPGE
jgi:3-keto-disaccharide hydrolase